MRTIIDKIWDAHVVAAADAAPPLIYIDLHLVHEVTSPQAFDGLRARGVRVRRPDLTFATVDHSIPTTPPGLPIADQVAAHQVAHARGQLRGVRHPVRRARAPDPGHRARDRPRTGTDAARA